MQGGSGYNHAAAVPLLVRYAGSQTTTGDPPSMEDSEKAELFWRKRSMTPEGSLRIPTSVLSRRFFPTPRATQSLPNGTLFAFARHWRPERDRIENAVGGPRAA